MLYQIQNFVHNCFIEVALRSDGFCDAFDVFILFSSPETFKQTTELMVPNPIRDIGHMKTIRAAAICWLIFLSAFFLGFFAYHSKIWPYAPIMNIRKFIKGHVGEQTTLVEKIQNDLNFKPSRYIAGNSGNIVLQEKNYEQINSLPINQRRKPPRMFISEKAPKGYRLIHGTFDFKESLHGAILIDPEGQIINIWPLTQKGMEGPHRPDNNVFPHGIAIAPDGSIAVAYDDGSSLTKYDYDGSIVWRVQGAFHHTVSFDGNGAIWVLKYGKWPDDWLMKIDYQTGETLKELHLKAVMDANPDIDIFGIVQFDDIRGSRWIGDPWHTNDVEALPEPWAAYYPAFHSGDLLVSLRSANLIFVMDPGSLKVKWWRQGWTRRQHDPDWNNKGTITVFNNNMHRGYSNIVEINPSGDGKKILVDGKAYTFYTWWRGKHQLLPDGSVLITSPDQGRVFEVNSKGEITFEFLNIYGDKDEYLTLSEALFLPTDYFTEDLL